MEECFHCTVSQLMWINKTWLDKLGLAMPQTTDDFFNVLQAFKTGDPNGNGKADEIPLSSCNDNWHVNIDGYLMNAFIGNDSNDRLNVVNGKIIPAFIQPEWRDGLAYINKLFKAGLLDKQTFIQDTSTLTQLVEGPIIRLGASPGGSPGSFCSFTGQPILNYTAVPPLKGPKGVQISAYYPDVASSGLDNFAITKYCQDPVTAIKFCDFLFTEESTLRNNYGDKGTSWDYAKPGEIGINGDPAVISTLGKPPVYTLPQQNEAWVHIAPEFWPNRLFLGVATKEEPGKLDIEKALYDVSNEYINFIPKEYMPTISYFPDEAKEIAG